MKGLMFLIMKKQYKVTFLDQTVEKPVELLMISIYEAQEIVLVKIQRTLPPLSVLLHPTHHSCPTSEENRLNAYQDSAKIHQSPNNSPLARGHYNMMHRMVATCQISVNQSCLSASTTGPQQSLRQSASGSLHDSSPNTKPIQHPVRFVNNIHSPKYFYSNSFAKNPSQSSALNSQNLEKVLADMQK
ncbi:4305_t:CDS:2, partial [Gigaspora rosea]